ncbi:MAG TPA: 6-pyruvoyl-tetrahydropterin synthase-related protein [Terracidiphilus sp.]|nr:6-pyruvoyl-tetrahydropterin synthase-related protein [Terracidiphilus sp.]
MSLASRFWRQGNFAGATVILLAAFVAIVPELIRGASCGHDFNVHLVSWFDCLNAWRHGIPYPHWTPSANYGAGEPRFVFYPPLTWMLGAALGAMLPWPIVPIALTFIIFAATGVATRALALEFLDNVPATLAGSVAIFSGFTLFTGYERCAFPEFAGGFWLPLILLYVLRDRDPAASLTRRAFSGSTAPLAVALAGAWLSNLPLGIIAGYLLVGVALLWAVVNKSWAPLLRAGVATILGLGLAALYWVPATLERHWVNISQATDDPGYNFENNWLFSHHANPVLAMHDVVLNQVSWIAVSMIAATLACAGICFLRESLPKPGKKWIPLAAIPLIVLSLLFPISRFVWHTLPEFPFLQYPWRWLEAVEAPMAIFFVAAVWPANPEPAHDPRIARRRRTAVAAVCAMGFIGATMYASKAFFQVCYPEDTVASSLQDYRSGAGFEGMYEYAPANSDISNTPTGIPGACLVTNPEIVLGKPDPDDPDVNPAWTSDQGTCQASLTWAGGSRTNPEHRRIVGGVPHEGYLVLHLLRYPAWVLRLNNRPLPILPLRMDGLIVVPVHAGPINLTVDWSVAPGDIAGRWMSILSALLLIGLSIAGIRRRHSRLT